MDVIVESENSEDNNNGNKKKNIEKEIIDILQFNSNELDLKSNGYVACNNEKKINIVKKQLIGLSWRRHEEYWD